VDGEFPWVLLGLFLLWIFRILGGKPRAKVERPPRRREFPDPLPPSADQPGSTQSEGARLEELLRALERRLDPTAAERQIPRPTTPPSTPSRPPLSRPAPSAPARRGPLGRPAVVRLPEAEDLEERESLEAEAEPVVESLEREVPRPERQRTNRLAQAEAKERARLAAIEARDREPHRARHAAFDQRIRAESAPTPTPRRLTTEQMRQAFIWAEILGRPKGDT
jgi:hypothetical protein